MIQKRGLTRKKKPRQGGWREHAADDAFDSFWAVYPKHVGEEPARKAFAKAVKAGIDPETIIDGAKAYAAVERDRLVREPGQERYTAHAANWLRDSRWKYPPPSAEGTIIDGTPRHNGQHPKRTWDDIARSLKAKYAEADNA